MKTKGHYRLKCVTIEPLKIPRSEIFFIPFVIYQPGGDKPMSKKDRAQVAAGHLEYAEESAARAESIFDEIGDKQGKEEAREVADKAEKAAERIRSLLNPEKG